jgi:DNA-binding LytR/AlgR family response regulator
MVDVLFKLIKRNIMEYLCIPGVNHVLEVPSAQIARVEAKSNYSTIYLLDGKHYVYSKILSWFEERLPENSFLRVNRAQIINRRLVGSIVGDKHKNVILLSGECFPISRRRQTKIKKAIAA